MSIERINELVNAPRDIIKEEFLMLCAMCCNERLFMADKRCFREPTDAARMWSVINDCSMAEARRRNARATVSYSTGLFDVRWGVVQAGKKDKEIYIINPYEEWELKK